MKVFISHSSKDKWAARRISEDLISFGIKTFLDEKDIETGHSIDDSIKTHLKSCDDFLIVLSPASIKSEWVLVELGGALALDKKIIPILLYVGANEMPKVINLKLARDINAIQAYYDEIKEKISGKKTKVVVQKKNIKSSFKKGDKVSVVSSRPPDVMRNESLIDWEPEMDKFLGKKAIIEQKSSVEGAYLLDIGVKYGRNYYIFAEEWLKPLK